MSGSIATVHGRVPSEELGWALMSERVVFDRSALAVERPDALGRRLLDRRVSLDVLDALHHDPEACRDALIAPEDAVLQDELTDFARHGGRTVVDVTGPREGRDVRRLRSLAAASGVHIVASATLDAADAPANGPGADPVDDLDGAGVRAGQLRLTGVGWPLREDDREVLRRAGRTQRRTGLALAVHPSRPDIAYGPEVARILVRAGADPRRVLIGGAGEHLEVTRLRALLATGVTVAFDSFGAELRWPSYGGHRTPREVPVSRAIVGLLHEGYADQLVVSHGVCTKLHLRAFGGWGLRHVPRQVSRRLRDLGASQDELDRMMRRTPARLLGGE